MNFEEKLNFGRIAEKQIENILLSKDYKIIRSYDYKGEDDKAPKMFGAFENLVIPDLDCSKDGKRIWVEVKHYSISPFNRRLGCKIHGIKKRLYDDYLRVEKESGCPVFIFIVERESNSILYGKLSELNIFPCQCKNCESNNYDSCSAPMKQGIYFKRDELKELIPMEKLNGKTKND